MRTVVRSGLVFDGTGTEPFAADVVINNGVIAEVTRDADTRDDDELIDAAGATILPGLIDCHVHVVMSGKDPLAMMQEPFSYQFYAAEQNLRRTLDIGVTTVRDAGGADLGMKQAVADGLIDGPDIVPAITILGQTGGHTDGWTVSGDVLRFIQPHPGRPDGVVDGVEGMRQRVRELIRAGAEVIKICTSGGVLSPRDDPRHPQFSPEELAVCVAEADAVGIPVMAHAQGKPGILNALRAGVSSIEHGIYADDECFELMRETGAVLVPTLLAPVALIQSIDEGARQPAAIEAKARAVVQTHRDMVGAAARAGVRIAMGTDSGVFAHGRAIEELALMVEVGMMPAEVLVAATSRAADLLRLPDRGRIAAGMRADLNIVTGDVFDVATHAERLTAVFKAGSMVRAAT